MKSPEEYREHILGKIKRAYKLIRQYERLLDSRPLARVYKNLQCKSALKQQDRINEIKSNIRDAEHALVWAWERLPEITDNQVIDMLAAKSFAAQLCKPKRNPRFLKNQGKFLD